MVAMKFLASAALITLLSIVGPPCHAQSPGEIAIQKGREGMALYERGDFKGALALFREADALYHSPVLTLYAARAQRKLKKLLEAKALYQALANERIDEDAHESWKKAHEDGAIELREIEAEIPRATVVVRGAKGPVRIWIDGHETPLRGPIELDPGDHRFVLEHGGRRHTKPVSLQAGESNVVFDLRRARPDPDKPKPAEGPNVPGLVLTSLGGAALIAGGIVGAIALKEANDAKANLPASCDANRSCPPHEQAAIDEQFDSIYTLSHVSDGLLIGGAVLAAVGIVLLIVNPGGESAVTADKGLKLSF